MSCLRRSDGRLLVRVHVPFDVVERADGLALTTGRDRADMLGDLVAEQLPDLLADTARALLRTALQPPAATPSDSAEGASGRTSLQEPAVLSIPASDGTEPEPDGAPPT